MSAALIDPTVECRVLRAAKDVELAVQYGLPTGLALAEFDLAREAQREVHQRRLAAVAS